MKIIIAGSRTITEKQARDAIESCPWIGFASCIVSGGARGADFLGELWAVENGLLIERYLADWRAFGRSAGPVRNKKMAESSQGLIALWDGKSRGTANMIEYAVNFGLRVFIFRFDISATKEMPPSGFTSNLWEIAEERAGVRQFAGGLTRKQAEREAGKDVGLVFSMRDSGSLEF